MRTLSFPRALILLLLSAIPSAAMADQRALVFGINDYAEVPKLTRAVGDAKAMSAELSQLGFSVTTVLDPNRRQMNEAISAFRLSLRPGDTAFVHFSGHGVEVGGRDLLLPSDIPLPAPGQEDFLAEEAIDLTSLMDRVSESGATVRVFIVDACRDNPFQTGQHRGLGQTRGLAIVEPPQGSFVLYSAGYGQTALDGLGPEDASETSVYTRVLLAKLRTPGLTISQIARDVRSDVAALASSVGHEQYPAYYDGLTEDYYVLPPPSGLGKPSANVESAAFDAAMKLGTETAWNAFLDKYPDGVFADLVKAALKRQDRGAGAAQDADQQAIIDDYQAGQKLQELWSAGRRYALAGDEVNFFLSMDNARQLARDHFGAESVEYADANNQLVGALSNMGRIDEAMAAEREAIRVYTAHYGATDPRVLNEQANLAARLAATDHYDEAEALFSTVLADGDQGGLANWNAINYAHALEGYAQLQGRLGKLQKALDYSARSISVAESAGVTATIDYGWLLATKGHLQRQAGMCRDAVATFTEADAAMKAAGVAETQADYAQIIELAATRC